MKTKLFFNCLLAVSCWNNYRVICTEEKQRIGKYPKGSNSKVVKPEVIKIIFNFLYFFLRNSLKYFQYSTPKTIEINSKI